MKRPIGSLLLFVGVTISVIFSANAARSNQAHSSFDVSKLGLGVVLGSPTAITGKYWFDKLTAVDAGVSWGTDYYFLIYGDYLMRFDIFGNKAKFWRETTGYLGFGGGLYNWSGAENYGKRPVGWRNSGNIGLYARVPVGAEWRPPKPSVGCFAEIAPGLALIPGVGVTVDGGIGIRYYFQ